MPHVSDVRFEVLGPLRVTRDGREADDQGTLLFARRAAATAAGLGVQLPSASRAASVRAPVADIAGLVTR